MSVRKIIHIDMDCFFAAVEMRDKPSLKGLPIVVGGHPKSRGVVSTCSYEARKFGIHSAMACSKALKLCPKAIFITPNFEKYKAVSFTIQEIFRSYTPIVEPLSLDEAYLDVTKHNLYAVKIAKKIRQEIFQETRLTASAGIAPNKLIAKIASDINKPNGSTLVLPSQVRNFIGSLPLRKIPGIGPATEKQLIKQQLYLCSDIWAYSLEELIRILGENRAQWLHERCRGIDGRLVKSTRVRKSLGTEDTFSYDIKDYTKILSELSKISESVAKSLKKKNLKGKTVTLKVKYKNFKQITRSKTFGNTTNSFEIIYSEAKKLLQKTEAGQTPIRLIGVCISNFTETETQRSLFDIETL